MRIRLDQLVPFVARYLTALGYTVEYSCQPGASRDALASAPWHGHAADALLSSLYRTANGWSFVAQSDRSHPEHPDAWWEAEMAPLEDVIELHRSRIQLLDRSATRIRTVRQDFPELGEKIDQMPYLVRMEDTSGRSSWGVDIRDPRASVWTCYEQWWTSVGCFDSHGRFLSGGIASFLENWASMCFREPKPSIRGAWVDANGIDWSSESCDWSHPIPLDQVREQLRD